MDKSKVLTIIECVTGFIGLIGVIFVAKAGTDELDNYDVADDTMEDTDGES